MYRLPHVVNSILAKGREAGVSISPMKLQKLLYFFYRDYLKATQTPLFGARFEPWPYGPVVPEVYYAFKGYNAEPIDSYMLDEEGHLRQYSTDGNDAYARVFNAVWRRYGILSGIELSKVTHKSSSAWYKAMQWEYVYLRDDDIKGDTADVEPDESSFSS